MFPLRWIHLFLLFSLLVLAGGGACSFLEDGPDGRRAKEDEVQCFQTFEAAKKAMHAAGEPKLPTHQWHHIVGQHKANIARFGARNIHCTDNLVYIPKTTHQAISGHYVSKTRRSKDKRVYEWLAEQDFDQQYEYGVAILIEYGIDP